MVFLELLRFLKRTYDPTELGSRLSKTGDLVVDPHLYRSVVDALQYVTITRPEISYAINKLCQFMYNPTDVHWQAVKRLLPYLKGTLTLRPTIDNWLVAFSDTGWASDGDGCSSQHGFAIFYGGNLII